MRKLGAGPKRFLTRRQRKHRVYFLLRNEAREVANVQGVNCKRRVEEQNQCLNKCLNQSTRQNNQVKQAKEAQQKRKGRPPKSSKAKVYDEDV